MILSDSWVANIDAILRKLLISKRFLAKAFSLSLSVTWQPLLQSYLSVKYTAKCVGKTGQHILALGISHSP